jgi:large subunit ribosomal protein L21
MSGYAVVQVGTHQYRIEKDMVFDVELLERPEDKQEVKLDQVLLVQDSKDTQVGTPFVDKASVTCQVVEEIRLPKVVSFKFKKRKQFKKKKGHRQTVLRLKVKSIQAG